MKHPLHLALALAVSFSSILHAADWPRFLGPEGTGICREPGLNLDWSQKSPAKLWSIPFSSEEGYSGPIVVKGVVYILDNKGADGLVRALDLKSGREIWSFTYPNPGKKNYGFAKSSPAFDNGKIYAIGQRGEVFCLDAKNGQKIWATSLLDLGGEAPKWDYSCSPLIDGDRLILCPGGQTSVVALNKTTGSVIWKGGANSKAGYSTPAAATLGGKAQYLVFSGTDLSGVNPADGKILWSLPWKTGYDINAIVPLVFEQNIFISSAYGHGSALLEISGDKVTPKWENKEILARFSTPILVDGFAYSTGDQNALVCLDVKTGQLRWKGPNLENGGLTAVPGAIIGLDGKNSDIVLFKTSPERYEELGRIKGLGGRSWTAPVIADGKLLIRNLKELACFDLK